MTEHEYFIEEGRREQAERIAELEAEIERLNGDLKCVRQLQDTFWAALKKLNLASIYVSNPGLHFTERIAALEAENAELKKHQIPDGWICHP